MSESTALISEPFHSLRRLERRAGRVGAVSVVVALAVHAGVFQGAAWSALLGIGISDAHAHPKPLTVELEVDPPPPPPVVPEVVPEPPVEKLPPTAPKFAATFVPASAHAGAALTAAPEEAPKLDDDSLVTAENETYAGGETDHDGTGGEASVGGTGAGAGPAVDPGPPVPPPFPPPPPPPDRSRAAKCPLDVDWECEHPNDSKDDKVVIVQIALLENGRVGEVKVLASPGEAFSREAVRCSSRQKCVPALDRNGVAIRGETNPIRVRFIR